MVRIQVSSSPSAVPKRSNPVPSYGTELVAASADNTGLCSASKLSSQLGVGTILLG